MKTARFALTLLAMLFSVSPVVHRADVQVAQVTFGKWINKSQVVKDEPFTVTLTLKNTGDSRKSCKVVDPNPSPAHLEIVPGSLTPPGAQLAGNTVSWEGNVLAGRTQKVTFRMRVKAVPGGPLARKIVNKATFSAAGQAEQTRTATVTIVNRSYVPDIANNYAPLTNGDFGDKLAGWRTRRGKFDGHGSGLPVTLATGCAAKEGATTPNCALLGDADAVHDQIPVGYGSLERAYTVPAGKAKLSVTYKVWSHDAAYSTNTQEYYDTFEVSVNVPPASVKDAARDAQGCQAPVNASKLYPVATDGLVFCSGSNKPPSQTQAWNSGWVTAVLDLGAYAGKTVTLYFAIWSREHQANYLDDKAGYNTWAYVDQVEALDSGGALAGP